MKLGKLFAKAVPGLALKLADEVITEITVSNPDDTIFDDIEKKLRGRKRRKYFNEDNYDKYLTDTELGEVLNNERT